MDPLEVAMKISNSPRKMNKLINTHSGDDKRVADVRQASFNEHMTKAEGMYYEERIAALIDEICKQGEKLSKKVDIKELAIYKKLISEFLEEAVNNSHKFSKENFLDRRGRYRMYAIIKKVNQQLDALTEEVLREERDNLKILQRLDDIRGLLLDMLM